MTRLCRASLLLCVLALFGCATPPDKDDGADEIVGTPPEPREDPFFFVAMPAQAVPAETSGTIGAEEPARVEPAEPSAPPETEATPPAAEASSGVAAAEVERAEPTPAPPTEAQCFSCIKICPADAPEGQCGREDDVICGWGVHPESSTARRRATAECEGALELVRQSPRWSRVEGSCPAATCR